MASTSHPEPACTVAASAGAERFVLQRVLGEGAQACVWLAFDQRLQRPVALKRMCVPIGADAQAAGAWLRELRSVGRLSHPNIVPLYDAELSLQGATLVYEYVDAPTLAARLDASGAMPVHEAVALAIDVLDALQAAHAAGVVHRDLKASNVLIGAAGRARVMDFGIAATLGAAPTVAMDLHAVGVMLVEALTGRRPPQAEAELPAEFDDSLRAALRRALAHDATPRWQSAAEFRDALQACLAPPPAALPDAASPAPSGALDFLLRRMRHHSDFPALTDAVQRIQRVADAGDGHLERLSDEILKDVALTAKLLRIVNSVHFQRAGAHVGTVSRAVALVGFDGIRNLALSLVLLEHMRDKAHAQQLQQEFLRSLLAGMLAGELGAQVHDGEQAFIGAMFQNLGRQLTGFYFPEEAQQVRNRISAGARTGARTTSEAAASTAVLGLSYEQLGLAVARVWGLPPALQRCMLKPAGEPPPREPADAGERLRWRAHAANLVADALLAHAPDAAQPHIAALARRHARVLGLPAEGFEAAVAAARERLAQMVQSMSLQLAPQSPARRLFADAADDDAPAAAELLESHALPAAPPAPDAASLLLAGIDDAAQALADGADPELVLRAIMDTMRRALGLQRVLLCRRDTRGQVLLGHGGVGADAAAVAARFKVPLARGGADLFGAVCLKGADLLIHDATLPRIAASLPAWYRDGVAAPSLLLLPLQQHGKPLALLYADAAAPGGIAPGERERALLRTLRHLALLALKPAY